MAQDPDQLLTPREVAIIFRVHEKTIRRWTAAGDLDDCVVRTPGGRLRYRAAAIRNRAAPPAVSDGPAPGLPGAPGPVPVTTSHEAMTKG